VVFICDLTLFAGAIFPNYELSDHPAKRRKLSEVQAQDPMILVLSRGGFCPKDRRQAEGLVQLPRELEVAYWRLVTITTDNLTETNEYRSGVGAHWPFLSAARRIVQKDLDIADAGLLNVGYAETGALDGRAVILLHGWPYDIHSYVDVAPLLASVGYRVIVPYLRGYGTTRFLSSETVRNGH
jgi:peroxiredoxin